MAKFEDRLWSELIAEPAAQLGCSVVPAPRKRRLPSKVIVALAALAMMIGVVILALPRQGQPAYAVSMNENGLVTLTIKEAVGIGPANARMAQLGIRVKVAKVKPGCTEKGKAIPPNPSLMAEVMRLGKIGPGFNGERWIINTLLIPPGDTLGLTFEQVKKATFRGKPISEVAGQAVIYEGPAPECAPPVRKT